MNSSFLSLVAAGLALCAHTRADIISYSTSLPVLTPSALAATTIRLQGFDATLGTLTQVKLSFTSEIVQSAQAENLAGSGAGFTFLGQDTLSFGHVGGPALFHSSEIQFTRSATLAAFDSVLDYDGVSGLHFTQNGAVLGDYRDANLAAYVTSRTVDFSAALGAISTWSASGGIMLAGSSVASSLRLAVEYGYTPALVTVPETPTFAVFAGLAALGGVIVVRRRYASGGAFTPTLS